MKKNSIIYLTFIGLIGLLSSCEKDGTNVVISDQVVKPTIVTLPNLTLTRATGTQTLKFVGTFVDPGFKASANYFLEACAKGNNFVDAITVISSIQDTAMKITVSDLNGILLKKFPGDVVSQLDFRIRAVLVRDGGTGVASLVYISDVKSAAVTLYGLPRLDLLSAGITQKVESALGDGKYFGYVKLDLTQPFTLKDPDANIVYGATGTALAVNGSPIAVPSDPGNGWYQLTVDTKALTYTLVGYRIGLIGSAVAPYDWSVDQPMDYNSANGTWNITADLSSGQMKFRYNAGWAWNLGWNPGKTALIHNGDNIDVTAGNYTISLTITKFAAPEEGTFTIKKN